MSRVVELHQDWMKDPAFRQEFAKLEEELKQLKGVARGRPGKGTGTEAAGALARTEGAADAADLSARKRSA